MEEIMKKKEMELTLCYKCKNDFEEAGKKIKRTKYQENKEACDYCNTRMGFTYIVSD